MKTWTCALALASVSTAALALPVTPVPFQVADETARFVQGVPTLTIVRPHGAVLLTPLELDHGSVAFALVVENDGAHPAEFDLANVTAEAGGVKLMPLSREQLEGAAKRRAAWSQVGLALVAGAAAAASANASTTSRYHGRVTTSHGTYRFSSTVHDNALGRGLANTSLASGADAVAAVRGRLDATLAALKGELVQRTTLDPGDSYGGKVIMQKITGAKPARDIIVHVTWNGDDYAFGLHIPKAGDPAIMPVSSGSAISEPQNEGRPARAPDTLPIMPRSSMPVDPAADASTRPKVDVGPAPHRR